MAHYIALILMQTLVSSALADIATVGNPISPGMNSPSDGKATWVELSATLPVSVVIRWRIFSRLPHKPVLLQIWRPVGDNRYALLAEHRVVPTSIGLHEFDLPHDERVSVQAGDRLGFTNVLDQGPIAFVYEARDADVIRYENKTLGLPELGGTYVFDSYKYGRRHSFNVDIVVCDVFWEVVDLFCARFMTSSDTWSGARDYCETKEGHLVTPKTTAFSRAIQHTMMMKGWMHSWMGATHDDLTHAYRWTDDQRGIIADPSWAPGEPSSTHACASLALVGTWDVKNCSFLSPFICQAKERPIIATTEASTTVTVALTTLPTEVTTVAQLNVTAETTAYLTDALNMTSINTTASQQPEGTLVSEQPTDECPMEYGYGAGYMECLPPYVIPLLQQANALNRSLEGDIELLRNLSSSWWNSTGNATSRDMAAARSLLSAITDHGPFDHLFTDMDPWNVITYVDVLADVADAFLGWDCACQEAWSLLQETAGVMSTVASLEGAVGRVVMYNAQRHLSAEIQARSSSVEINIDVFEPLEYEYTDTYTPVYPSADVKLSIPVHYFSDNRHVGVSTVLYHAAHIFLPTEGVQVASNYSKQNTGVFNSKIVSVFVHPEMTSQDQWLHLTMNHLQPINPTFHHPVCGFWNQTDSSWSDQGCEISFWNETITSCRCNHATSFAILVQTTDFQVGVGIKGVPVMLVNEGTQVQISRDHQVALSFLTFVGCGLSVVGLFATIVAHLTVRCCSDRGKILVNLCMALMIADAAFIAGIDATYHRMLCLSIAVLLHYFYLAAFLWMLAQGLELYIKLRLVFTHTSRILHYSLLGWGIPAIIVAVSVGLRIGDYGRDNYCWLSIRTGLIWSFVGPVAFVTVVNFFILCVVLRTFRRPRPGKENTDKQATRDARSAARAALILLPVLGLTWVFGLLSVNGYTVLFQYVFTGCNALQGLLIFLFHCVFNEELKNSWRKRKRQSENGSGRTAGDVSSPPTRCSHLADDQSSVVTEQPSMDSIPSSEAWDVEKSKYRMFSLGCLLPGRSKMVAITDPKGRNNVNKDHSTL